MKHFTVRLSGSQWSNMWVKLVLYTYTWWYIYSKENMFVIYWLFHWILQHMFTFIYIVMPKTMYSYCILHIFCVCNSCAGIFVSASPPWNTLWFSWGFPHTQNSFKLSLSAAAICIYKGRQRQKNFHTSTFISFIKVNTLQTFSYFHPISTLLSANLLSDTPGYIYIMPGNLI